MRFQKNIKFILPFPLLWGLLMLFWLGACTTPQPSPNPPTPSLTVTLAPTSVSLTPTRDRVTNTPRSQPEVTRTPRNNNPEATNRPAPGLTPELNLTPFDLVPLTDLGQGTYLGFEGGLYPGGSNEMPQAHAEEGLRRANMMQPLDLAGNPDPDGKIVLLTVGMSNVTQEVCGRRQGRASCFPWTFIGMFEQDPMVDHDNLMIVDGARGGQVSEKWDSPTDENYDRVNEILTSLDLSEQQVQVAWVKDANLGPRHSLPSEQADAYELMRIFGDIVRTLKIRYPNLQQVYFSSRIYAGYTTYKLNPEPYAYESGFAVKWFIEAQISQMAGDGTATDPLVGDLNYDTVAPWIAWGPYLWANGSEARSDGLTWEIEDFDDRDWTHPSQSGEQKVGQLLLDFFKISPFTQCWFLSSGICE